MRKKISKFLLALALIPLVSCGETSSLSSSVTSSTATSSSTSTASSSQASSSSSVATAYTVLSSLQALQGDDARFTLLVEGFKTLDGTAVTSQASIFTPHYYYRAGDDAVADPIDTGYLAENGGVSSFKYRTIEGQLIRSELLKDADGKKITSLAAVAPSFKSVSLAGLSEAADGSVEFSRKKTTILNLFTLFGIDTKNYVSLVSAKGTMQTPKSPDGLHIEMTFSAASSTYYYVADINRFGLAKVNYLESFLANPLPPFAATTAEKRVQSLFAGKNFTQYRDDDGDDTIDQHDYFTDQYYWVDFTDAYATKDPETVITNGNKGYISINNKPMAYNGNTLVFLGCYLIETMDKGKTLNIITRPDPNNPSYAQSSFTQIYTDISKVMNYPGYLSAVNDFELATVDSASDSFTYSDTGVVNDFIANFNLAAWMATKKLTADYLTIVPTLETEDGDCQVVFDLYFTNKQYVEYIFKDFGTTHVSLIDSFITAHNLAN